MEGEQQKTPKREVRRELGGTTLPGTPARGVKRGLGGASLPSGSDISMPAAANHTISMLQQTEAASILSPASHQRVLHGYQTMLNESSVELDKYRLLIKQMETERKKLKEEKRTQELINIKMAEEMAALKRKQPDTTTICENIKKELVSDCNNRIETLKEDEEAKENSFIAAISAEFDAEAACFREEQTVKHQQELSQFRQEQIQHTIKHNKQLEDIAVVVKSLQAETTSKDWELDELRYKECQREKEKVEPSSLVVGSKLEYLKCNIFDFVPDTVNTNRGGAVPLGDTINFSETAYETPLHPKKFHFSSTPLIVNNDDL